MIMLLIVISCYSQTGEEYYSSGMDKIHQEDFKGAIVDFSKIIKLYPEYKLQVYMGRAMAKNYLKDYKGAIADYTKCLIVDPENYFIYVLRGCQKRDMKDYNGAIVDFTKALKFNPEWGSIIYPLRGKAKYDCKDYKGAITDYDKCIENNTSDSTIYYYLGLSKIKLGQKNNACTDLKKSEELGSKEASEALNKYCQNINIDIKIINDEAKDEYIGKISNINLYPVTMDMYCGAGNCILGLKEYPNISFL